MKIIVDLGKPAQTAVCIRFMKRKTSFLMEVVSKLFSEIKKEGVFQFLQIERQNSVQLLTGQ